MVDLQTRVVNILTKPQTEWPQIAVEQTDAMTLTVSYIAPLAAIPAAASFIGLTVIGITTYLGTRIRVGIVPGLVSAVIQYLLTIGAVHVSAIVVDKLAPTFHSPESTPLLALRLIAYSSTAAWVAGILNVIPALVPVAFLAGLYSIYLLYLGMQPMLKTPDAQVVPYMVVSAVIVAVLMIVALSLAGTLAAAL